MENFSRSLPANPGPNSRPINPIQAAAGAVDRVELRLASIRPNPAAVDPAAELQAQRNRLACELIYAARDLAGFQARYFSEIGSVVCAECQCKAAPGGRLEDSHSRFCRTARVLGILAQIEGLAAAWPESVGPASLRLVDEKGGAA